MRYLDKEEAELIKRVLANSNNLEINVAFSDMERARRKVVEVDEALRTALLEHFQAARTLLHLCEAEENE